MTIAQDKENQLLGTSSHLNRTKEMTETGMTSAQFEALLAQYGDSIYGFCYHLTGNRHNAEDLYQEAILTAFGRLGRINYSREGGLLSARNYIIGIAVKLNKNRIRRKSHRDSFYSADSENIISYVSDSSDIAAETEQKELRSAVRNIVEHLPEKLRIVTYLYYFADMSILDITEQLDIAEGTAKSRLSRARDRIKKELEDIYHE